MHRATPYAAPWSHSRVATTIITMQLEHSLGEMNPENIDTQLHM
jgi:hypothetical protein